jgi:hypothetical protein
VNRDAERLRGLPAAIVWVVAMVDIGLAVLYVFVANFAIPLNFVPPLLTMPMSFGLVGALLATRRRRNPIGWIFWCAGLVISLMFTALAAAERGPSESVWSHWLPDAVFLPTIVAVVLFVPLLFPTGSLPSRSWRPLAAIMVFGLATLMLPNMLSPGRLGESTFENPVGIPALGQLLGALGAASGVMALICFPIAAVAPVWRYRHGDPVERQQLKWFAAATAVAVPALLLAASRLPVISELGWTVGLLALGLMPVAIAVAILRYRLYEIDRIVSRTISYLIVTAGLVGVFAIVVVGLQAILASFTTGQGIPVAASTLVVFVMFQPLRRRVQSTIDRRFDRARYDGERTIASFAARLRDEVDLDSIIHDLRAVTGSTVQPGSASVWIRTRNESRTLEA